MRSHDNGAEVSVVAGDCGPRVCGLGQVFKPHLRSLEVSCDVAHTVLSIGRVVLFVIIDLSVDEKDPVVKVLVRGWGGASCRLVLLKVISPLQEIGVHFVLHMQKISMF